MSSLVRCPLCDSFIKSESLNAGPCAFCPSAKAATVRNPIPGIILAATIASVPGCKDEIQPMPVYGVPVSDASVGDANATSAESDTTPEPVDNEMARDSDPVDGE